MRHIAATFIALAVCSAAVVSADSLAGYHPEQLEALDNLYNSTNGPNWRNNYEWTNPLYCLRYGVVCDSLRNVISLDLSRNNLVGTLHISLQQLSAVTKINLAVNHLLGPIPMWYKMGNLTELTLSWNSLSGQLPDLNYISPKLTNLNLARNQLTGGINGVSMIPTLQTLDLSNNLFTDALNSVKFFLPNLKSLNLENNYFRGNLNWVKQVASVSSLRIAQNQFSGPATPLSALNSSSLVVCSIASNAFHCPVDPNVASKCPYSCSKCATTYDSCDLCLDPTCQWCSTDGTGVNGFCVEKGSAVFVCGGGFGLRTTTCTRNCTANAACSGHNPWGNSCAGTFLITLTPQCDIASGKCIPTTSSTACSKDCCWDQTKDYSYCC